MIAVMSIVSSSIAISINMTVLGVCAYLVIHVFFHAMLTCHVLSYRLVSIDEEEKEDE